MTSFPVQIAPLVQVPGFRALRMIHVETSISSKNMAIHRITTEERFYSQLQAGRIDTLLQKGNELWRIIRFSKTQTYLDCFHDPEASFVIELVHEEKNLIMLRNRSALSPLLQVSLENQSKAENLKLEILYAALCTRYKERRIELLNIQENKKVYEKNENLMNFCWKDVDCMKKTKRLNRAENIVRFCCPFHLDKINI